MKTSIIIISGNPVSSKSKMCLDSIYNNTKDFELILISVGIRPDFNHSREINRALSIANGKYIILMDDDVVVTENWIDGLINGLKSYPNVGIVGAKIFDKDGNLNHTGGNVSLFEFGWHFKTDIKKPTLRPYVTSACMLITQKAYKKIGKFDENFQKYGQDADYCIRAWEKGLKVVCTPECVVTHLVGATIDMRDDKWRVWDKDRKYFNNKWFNSNKYYEIMERMLNEDV